jgi:hypothetical protein
MGPSARMTAGGRPPAESRLFDSWTLRLEDSWTLGLFDSPTLRVPAQSDHLVQVKMTVTVNFTRSK